MKIIILFVLFNLIYSQNKKIDFNPDLLNDPEPNWPQIVNPLSDSFESESAISSKNESIQADIEGFRVQVFATQDRRKAEGIKEELSFKFGDIFSKFMEKDAAKWFSIAGLIIVAIAITIYFITK